MENSQLIKKQNGGYSKVYPLAFIQGIIDAETNEKLTDILIRYNHIYVPWKGSPEDTRDSVPLLMRRHGLWISYDKDGSLYTEWFKNSSTDALLDLKWKDSGNWEMIPNLSYINSLSQQIPNGAILPEMLSPALQEFLSEHHTIINLPDDEDLEQHCNVVRFKDRGYNPILSSGKGYKILRKNWSGRHNSLSQEMISIPNTIYEVRYDFDLGGKEIIIPTGCVLKFEGGSFRNGTINFNYTYISNKNINIFDNIVLVGKVSNQVTNTNWFTIDTTGTEDISKEINSLFSISTNTVFISKGIYKFSEINIDSPIIIEGESGSIIKPVLKYPEIDSCLKRVFTISNQDYFIIKNISILGDTRFNFNNLYIGDGLILCNTVKKVQFINCIFGDTRSGYPSNQLATTTIGQLITTQDCNYVEINGCEFYNHEAFEWINLTMPTLDRKDLKVVFNNNYIHDYSEGATPLLAVCDKLEINNNLFENCYYTGSLLNAHGNYVEFNNNIIRNCRMSSILDTTEWGQYRTDTVIAENNNIECLNAAFVVTLSKNIVIKNNVCKCFNAIVALGQSGDYEDKDTNTENLPACEMVTLDNNDFDFTYYDSEFELPTTAYRAGVCILPVYVVGTLLSINNNKFKFEVDELNRDFFFIQNMKNISFTNNYIDGISNSENSSFYKSLIKVNLTKSIHIPISTNEIERIVYNNNTNVNTGTSYYLLEIYRGSSNIEWFKVNFVDISGNKLANTPYLFTLYSYIENLNCRFNTNSIYLQGKTNASIINLYGDTRFAGVNYIGILNEGDYYKSDNYLIRTNKRCTCPKYILSENIGKSIELGSNVEWSPNNYWKALSTFTVTEDPIPEESESLPEGSILNFMGVSWIKLSNTGPLLNNINIGNDTTKPELDYNYIGSTFINTTYDGQAQRYTKNGWVNGDGTYCNKVIIVENIS